jgi:hypothetical protein
MGLPGLLKRGYLSRIVNKRYHPTIAVVRDNVRTRERTFKNAGIQTRCLYFQVARAFDCHKAVVSGIEWEVGTVLQHAYKRSFPGRPRCGKNNIMCTFAWKFPHPLA